MNQYSSTMDVVSRYLKAIECIEYLKEIGIIGFDDKLVTNAIEFGDIYFNIYSKLEYQLKQEKIRVTFPFRSTMREGRRWYQIVHERGAEWKRRQKEQV